MEYVFGVLCSSLIRVLNNFVTCSHVLPKKLYNCTKNTAICTCKSPLLLLAIMIAFESNSCSDIAHEMAVTAELVVLLAASSALYCRAMASASSSLTPGGFTVPDRALPAPPLATVDDAVDADAEAEADAADGTLKGPMLLELAADEARATAAILQSKIYELLPN